MQDSCGISRRSKTLETAGGRSGSRTALAAASATSCRVSCMTHFLCARKRPPEANSSIINFLKVKRLPLQAVREP